jgi:2',3'-cyclic-nucleotide 3'-phosphodiesterase
MGGSSLWLVPPEDSELYKTIHELIINKIPPLYPNASPPKFTPHVTLTSDLTSDHQPEAQQWLDSIALPESVSSMKVTIRHVAVGSIYYQKLTMRCDKTAELCDLAATCRAGGVDDVDSQQAQRWAKEKYGPHCSLM